MIRVLGVWYFLFGSISFFTICSGKSGFILTSPKVLDAGSTEHFVLALFDVPDNGNATLSLRSKGDDSIMAQSDVSTSNGYMTIQMEIPHTQDSKAWLQINGSFLGDKETSEKKSVAIRHKSVITFVQTDKPIYKPGQNVKIRVFPLDTQLRPLSKDALGKVWIEDPGSRRIAQWKKVNFSLGIAEFELPLSEEPVLGVWSIKTKIANFSDSQTFTVEEYVLPKFEVTIKAPKYLSENRNGPDVPVEVCAQYTYGKKVDGLLNVTFDVQGCRWSCKKTFQPLLQEERISGCHRFRVKRDQLFRHPHMGSFHGFLVVAQVTESGTGVTQNASAVIQKTEIELEMKFLGFEKGYQYFKPGLPLYETLRVSKSAGTPAAFKDIDVCYILRKRNFATTEVCQSYTTNERGEVGFSIPRSSPAYYKMELKARATREDVNNDSNSEIRQQSKKKVSLKAWFSSSGSHLQIHPLFEEVPCGEPQQVKIHYTTHNGSTINFHYQVMSKGRITHQGSNLQTAMFSNDDRQALEVPDDSSDNQTAVPNGKLPPYIGEFNLTLDASATISPTARLLVFYVRPDGEVVSDSKQFAKAHCLMNKADLGFRSERQYPSTEAEVLVSATPFSLCGVGVVDKSVHIMKPEKQISKEKVFTLLGGYDLSGSTAPLQSAENYCPLYPQYLYLDRDDAEDDYDFVIPKRGGFRRNLYRSEVYNIYKDILVDSITAFENAGMVIITNYAIETRPCHKETIRRPRPFPGRARGRTRSKWGRGGSVPSNFSGTDSETATYAELETTMVVPRTREKPDRKEKQALKSVAEIRSYFPETWLWELHTVGENGEAVFHKTLPDTVTEWVGSAICVHPATGLGISDVAKITAFQPFFISFTLPYSVIREEVIPVVITVFNYLTECLPIKLSLEPKEEYVIVRESRLHKLCVCGGESKTHRFYIRPVTLGRVNITVYGYSLEDDAICGNQTTVNLTASDAVTRQLLVEAEGFSKEEVFNNFVCPSESNGTFSTEIDLLLPTNVVQDSARAYFTIVGDVMAPALGKLDGLVRLPTGCGEQNMILFVPNIFVLDYLIASGKVTEEIKSKALSHMQTGYQRELRYRHEDGSYSAFGQSDKEGSLWLTAFVVRSFSHARRFITIDKKDLTHSTEWIVQQQLKDGCFRRVGTVLHSAMKGGLSSGGDSLAPLTAYVLIALLEAGFTNTEVMTNAMKCLESDTSPTSYSLALFAYATVLAKDTKAQDYLQQLESQAIKQGNEMFWKYGSESSRSVDIETAAYAILAMLEADGSNIPKVSSIVRWITRQRNSNGGFVSTQDTVMALQALAKYASFMSQSEVNIEAVIRSDELDHRFRVDESNRLVTQSMKIPVVPTIVDFEATGVGCALTQFSLRYNVLFNTGSEAFDLNVTTSPEGNNGCNELRIGMCMRYQIPRQTSNMVVVTMKMISGYIPNKTSIKKLYDDTALPLKRHDVDGSEIHFYFSELSNELKCFRFLITNEFRVEDVKPATVKLYDYYQTEWEITKNYEIPSSC